MSGQQPLVSVVTPVYNGGKYLRECIESVVAQSYTDWRYTIVDNRSTDDTLEIALCYARLDSRVRVHENSEFLPIIDNHNRAIGLIDADSVYCKPLMADDRLFPNCIEAMVSCALTRPSIGLVCSLAATGDNQILFDQLRLPHFPTGSSTTVLAGRSACRIPILEDRHFFGSPTTMLIRADLIRKRRPFYDPINVHADAESCYDILQESDFAFVHEALAYVREHEQSQTSRMLGLESMRAGRFYTLSRYGRAYLDEKEFQQCYRQRLAQYYAMLAGAAMEQRGTSFWKFHRRMLAHSGAPLSRARLGYAIALHISRRLASPRWLARNIAARVKGAMRKLGKRRDPSIRHH